MNMKCIKISLIAFGIILICLNIAGFFIPLRNDDIYQEAKTLYKNDIIYSYDEVLEIISHKEMSDEKFLEKANDAVNKGVAHYWWDEGKNKYKLRVPIYENYILFIASFIYPRVYNKYVFCDYTKNLERGVGLCDIHSIILCGILKNNIIASKIINLTTHIVVMAQVNNDKWYVADPDFGVLIKNSISEIEENPNIIKSYYEGTGNIDFRIRQFSSEGKTISNGIKQYRGSLVFMIERLSYIGIWIIPCFMFLLAFFLKSL